MRILVVDPGPSFSVMDVANGYVEAFETLGHEVQRYPFGEIMAYHERALRAMTEQDGDGHQGALMAARDMRGACLDFLPDLVLIVSGFFVPPETYDILRARGIKVAVMLTESPYEDDSQALIAARADVCTVNDPTNLEKFPNGIYLPHAYRPMHLEGKPRDDMTCDFCFVGTAYPSRIAYLESVDWTGIDVALAGNWQALEDESPLAKFVAHDREICIENFDTIDLYASCKVSLNLYRTEAARPELSAGWAMGPREVELAASGTFFLTEARGENREVLPMVPTVDDPSDLGDQIRWWLTHPEHRQDITDAARDAVSDRTFIQNAQTLLAL